MILVRDIEVYSLGEQHMLSSIGEAHVAYISKGKTICLSQIPRIFDVSAYRWQIQERLADEVADALTRVLQLRGVGVSVEASYLCMMMPGVDKQHARTVTSSLRVASFPETSRMSLSDSFMGELDQIHGLILVAHNVHRTS